MNIVKELEDQENDRPSRLSQIGFATGMIALSGAVVGGLYIAHYVRAENDQRFIEKLNRFDQSATPQIARDGFKLSGVEDVNHGVASIDLAVGSTCILHGVQVTYEGSDSDVTDVTSYDYSVPNGTDSYGQPRELDITFKNYQDLNEHVLQDKSCATLARMNPNPDPYSN